MHWETIEGGLRVHTPAKLNLYLEIGGRRSDGFHDIDSIFQAVSLHDVLEFQRTGDGTVVLDEVGMGEGENNLVYRAARRVQEAFLPAGSPLGVRIRLTKRIPAGAGLGGGSSDAAATVLALVRLWGLEVRQEELMEVAAVLGSDVPFFLVGGTARCRGRGERVQSLAGSFDRVEPFHYVLVYPRIKVSTKAAYDALDASRGPGFTLTPPSALDSMPPEEIRARLRGGTLLFNRFERVVTELVPELKGLYEVLREEAPVGILLSGSGSTVFGLCRSALEAQRLTARLTGRLDAEVFAASSECSHGGLEGARGPFR